MKKVFSVIAVAVAVTFTTADLQAQESFGNAGLEILLPVGDWATDAYSLGVGGSGGMEFGLSDKFAVTANVGIAFFAVDDAVSDLISSAWIAPIQVGGRYYLSEQRSGLFLEAKAGVHIFGLSTEDVDLGPLGTIEGESSTETYFSVAPQVGYFLNENLSIALRYNLFFIPEDEEFNIPSDTGGYIGLKVAYNF